MYGEFQTSEAGRYAFHTPEGLCRLQLECGEETLPRVCRVFPRMERYMPSGYLERSLSSACEGVLALLWDLRSGMPIMASREELWKSYVNLCNLYGFYRFL